MLSISYLEDVIQHQNELLRSSSFINRRVVEEVEKTLKMEEISVLIGARRSGKTSIMGLILQKRQDSLFVNLEDERLYDFSVEDFDKLMFIARKNNARILMLDEVQNVKGWEKFAHRAHKEIKIVVSGSNSSLLNTEFSTVLTGRTKTIKVSPLDFTEFSIFRNEKPSKELLLEYMKYGGFPRVVLSKDPSILNEYLNAIIYRDVVARSSIKNPETLKDLAIYLLSNIGKEFSYRKLGRVFDLNEKTVKEYIHLLEEVFLLSNLKKFDFSLKKQERHNKKVYSVDIGMANVAPRIEDKGRIFENVIFNHLNIYWNERIFFYKNKREVDFLLCKGLNPQYAINSVFEVEKKETLNREVEGIKEAENKFKIKGYLISFYPSKNIETLDSIRFLTNIADYIPQK